jgi:hypothetical protein
MEKNFLGNGVHLCRSSEYIEVLKAELKGGTATTLKKRKT